MQKIFRWHELCVSVFLPLSLSFYLTYHHSLLLHSMSFHSNLLQTLGITSRQLCVCVSHVGSPSCCSTTGTLSLAFLLLLRFFWFILYTFSLFRYIFFSSLNFFSLLFLHIDCFYSPSLFLDLIFLKSQETNTNTWFSALCCYSVSVLVFVLRKFFQITFPY